MLWLCEGKYTFDTHVNSMLSCDWCEDLCVRRNRHIFCHHCKQLFFFCTAWCLQGKQQQESAVNLPHVEIKQAPDGENAELLSFQVLDKEWQHAIWFCVRCLQSEPFVSWENVIFNSVKLMGRKRLSHFPCSLEISYNFTVSTFMSSRFLSLGCDCACFWKIFGQVLWCFAFWWCPSSLKMFPFRFCCGVLAKIPSPPRVVNPGSCNDLTVRVSSLLLFPTFWISPTFWLLAKFLPVFYDFLKILQLFWDLVSKICNFLVNFEDFRIFSFNFEKKSNFFHQSKTKRHFSCWDYILR